ncbi:hypothetical protein [Nocardia beijingensis]|uniref:hypothetical protein n=1 Tax=Nocardia beijingensis TaxID=95162 RepID=UPI0033DC26DD
MDWLSFVSSLVWPGVALTALVMFRKNLNFWFSQRPDKIKAGPLEAEWRTYADRAAEELESGRDSLPPAVDGNQAGANDDRPTAEPLTLQLREHARDLPALAVLEGWAIVESELTRVLQERGIALIRWGNRFPSHRELIQAAVQEEQLPQWIVPTLNSMRELRNIAAHASALSSGQAFEFLALADLVLGELKRGAAGSSG